MSKSRKIRKVFNSGGSKQLVDDYTNKIKIIGLGSAGCDIINHLCNLGIVGIDFIVCTSDEQLIDSSRISSKIRLIDRVAVDMDQLFDLVDFTVCDIIMDSNAEVVLIINEIGKTTEAVIVSEIARVAKKRGIITVGIVLNTLFPEAKESNLDIDKLLKEFDSSLVIDRNKSKESKTIPDLDSHLSQMNESVASVVKGIAAIILEPQFDRNDIKTVLCDNNRIFAGFAVASGKNRVIKAFVSALTSSQLRKNNMANIKNVLLLFTSGTIVLTIDEIGEIIDYFQAAAGYNASITVAVSEDMKLDTSLSIAIIAS
jgi:cell division protein FtsZ